jgi:hypothetical protein
MLTTCIWCRIELGEVEAVFSSHTQVEQCVAIVRNNALVAYIKLLERQACDVATLKAFAGRYLTDYMLARHILFVDSFPKTANGKLDRKALPEPVEANHTVVPAGDRPTTLVDIITNAAFNINGQRPPPDSSVTALGIDSLASVIAH